MLFLQQLNCCGLGMKSGIVIEPEDRIAFRKKLYGSIEELQADLDQWLEEFNCTRVADASANPRCRPSLTQNRLRRKK